MKTSILSVIFSRFSLDHAFESAARAGYDGIDLGGCRSHCYPFDMDTKRVDHILKLKDRCRLETPVYCLDLLAHPYNMASVEPLERADAVELISRAIDVSADLGVPKLLINAGHTGYATTRKQNYENLYQSLEPLVKRAEEKRIILLYEPLTIMESNVVVFADDVREVLDHFHSPYLKTMMDTVTPIVNKESYAEHFEKLGKDIAHMHFVDSNGKDQTHMLLGTGVLDLPALRDLIAHYGYDGWLCIEVISRGVYQPDLIAARELRYLKELFQLGESAGFGTAGASDERMD